MAKASSNARGGSRLAANQDGRKGPIEGGILVTHHSAEEASSVLRAGGTESAEHVRIQRACKADAAHSLCSDSEPNRNRRGHVKSFDPAAWSNAAE